MKHHSISKAPFQIRWGTLGAIVILLSAAGLVAGSAWLSIQFIVNPRSVGWLNQYLPEGARFAVMGGDEPRTLVEVQAALKKVGLTTGNPILLNGTKARATSDLLLPIVRQKPDCQIECDAIVELRVYRPISDPNGRSKKEYVQMVSQLELDELEESFVLEPLAAARLGHQGSTRALPFATIQRFEDKAPAQGTWLNLAGQLGEGDATVAYGQVIYYNPDRTRLIEMLRWTSPTGESPVWQKPAKGNPPELWVNQTVGLEPNFQVYQLRSRKSNPDPFYLAPVSLEKPAIDNGAYVDALYLARNGLWSTALEILQSVKKRSPSEWTLAAQLQMSLVARHAEVTRSQSEKPWVSIGQQTLVNLIDGRWIRALQLFQTSAADQNEIVGLLKVDSGQLWKRVNAALHINPVRQDVQTWGALILASQQDRSRAIVWLKRQPSASSVSHAQIIKLLNQLDSGLLDPDSEITTPLTPQKPPRPAQKTVKPSKF